MSDNSQNDETKKAEALQRVCESARRLAKARVMKERLAKALANWPTKKEQPKTDEPG